MSAPKEKIDIRGKTKLTTKTEPLPGIYVFWGEKLNTNPTRTISTAYTLLLVVYTATFLTSHSNLKNCNQ
jgi:hypothetical protein